MVKGRLIVKGLRYLKGGKVYDIEDHSPIRYKLKNDKGEMVFVTKGAFEVVGAVIEKGPRWGRCIRNGGLNE